MYFETSNKFALYVKHQRVLPVAGAVGEEIDMLPMSPAVFIIFALWSMACVWLFGWLLGSVVAAVSWLTIWFLVGAVTTKLETGSWHFDSQSENFPLKVLAKPEKIKHLQIIGTIFFCLSSAVLLSKGFLIRRATITTKR
jgi:hypothetical protein